MNPNTFCFDLNKNVRSKKDVNSSSKKPENNKNSDGKIIEGNTKRNGFIYQSLDGKINGIKPLREFLPLKF